MNKQKVLIHIDMFSENINIKLTFKTLGAKGLFKVSMKNEKNKNEEQNSTECYFAGMLTLRRV